MEDLLLAPVHLHEVPPAWGWGEAMGALPPVLLPQGNQGTTDPPFVPGLGGPPAAISSPTDRARAEGRWATPPRPSRLRTGGAAGAHAQWRRRRLYIGAGGRRCRRIADGSGGRWRRGSSSSSGCWRPVSGPASASSSSARSAPASRRCPGGRAL